MRAIFAAALLCLLAACVPPPDQPAHYGRMGRFMGLVANCGCSGIGPDQMVAQYRKALGDLYSPKDVAAMEGYVKLGAGEAWTNMTQVCAEVCSQRCMVQAVVEPLGAPSAGPPPCLVSERDLHLTDGTQINTGDPGTN